MVKFLSVFAVLAVMAGCASPSPTHVTESLSYRQQGLNSASISAGACDDVGQFIPMGGTTVQEASAAPTP